MAGGKWLRTIAVWVRIPSSVPKTLKGLVLVFFGK